jgi:hypothetical protein
LVITSERGVAGWSRVTPDVGYDWEKRESEGGGDEKSRRSAPRKGGGMAVVDWRAEARESASVEEFGWKRLFEARWWTSFLVMVGANGSCDESTFADHDRRNESGRTTSSPDSYSCSSKLPPTQAILSPCAVVKTADLPGECQFSIPLWLGERPLDRDSPRNTKLLLTSPPVWRILSCTLGGRGCFPSVKYVGTGTDEA